MLADTVEQKKDAAVGDIIAHIIAFASRGQNALILEDTELLADQRLSDARRLHNLCHGTWLPLLPQKVQDTKPNRMCRVANDRSHTLQRFHVDEFLILCFIVYHNIAIPLY